MLSLKCITRQQVHWAYTRYLISTGRTTEEVEVLKQLVASYVAGGR